MIPEAREVHLSRRDRKVLEACCRSPVTLHRDLKRARIVLLAADGRSTRSIAKEVGVQPRIVSLWRHRYADHGLEGPQDKPRPEGHRQADFEGVLDKPAPQGFARWTGPLLAEALGAVYPAGIASRPSAIDKYVLPTPGGPSSSTLSPLAIHRDAARSRICFGSIDGCA